MLAVKQNWKLLEGVQTAAGPLEATSCHFFSLESSQTPRHDFRTIAAAGPKEGLKSFGSKYIQTRRWQSAEEHWDGEDSLQILLT